MSIPKISYKLIEKNYTEIGKDYTRAWMSMISTLNSMKFHFHTEKARKCIDDHTYVINIYKFVKEVEGVDAEVCVELGDDKDQEIFIGLNSRKTYSDDLLIEIMCREIVKALFPGFERVPRTILPQRKTLVLKITQTAFQNYNNYKKSYDSIELEHQLLT